MDRTKPRLNNSRIGYSVGEVVALSSVGRGKVYQEIAAGRLIARKVGRRTIVLHDDLEAWLNNLPTTKGKAALST